MFFVKMAVVLTRMFKLSLVRIFEPTLISGVNLVKIVTVVWAGLA